MAKYFDVQRALTDGYTQKQVDAYMTRNGLAAKQEAWQSSLGLNNPTPTDNTAASTQAPAQPVSSQGSILSDSTNNTPAPQLPVTPTPTPSFAGPDSGAPAPEGFFQKAARFLAPATSNIAQDIGSSMFMNSDAYKGAVTSARGLQDQATQFAMKAENTDDPVKRAEYQRLATEADNQAQALTRQLTPNASADITRPYWQRALAGGAEVGTLATPIEAQGLTAPGRIASVAGQGALLAGARRATKLSDESLQNRAIGTAGNAALGGVLAGGLQAGGEVLNKIAQGEQAAGQGLRQSVLQPKVKASPWFSEDAKALQNAAQEQGFWGTPQMQADQMANRASELMDNAQGLAENSPGTIDAKELKGLIHDAVVNNTNYVPKGINAGDYEGAEKMFTDQVLKEAEGGNVSVGSQFAAKQNLGDQIAKAWTAPVLTPKQEVGEAIYHALDGSISKSDPLIGQTTGQVSTLYDLSKGLQTAVNKGAGFAHVGIVPLPIPQAAVDLTKDIGGMALNKAAPVLAGAANQVGPTAEQAAALAPGMLSGQPGQTPQDLTNSPAVTNPGINDVTQPNAGGLNYSPAVNSQPNVLGTNTSTLPNTPTPKPGLPTPDQFKTAYLADMQETGGKNFSKIQAMEKGLYPTGKTVSPFYQRMIEESATTLRNMDLLKQAIGLRDSKTGKDTGQIDRTKLFLAKHILGGSMIDTLMNQTLRSYSAARSMRGGTTPTQEALNMDKGLYGINPLMSDEVIKQRLNAIEQSARGFQTAPAQYIGAFTGADTGLPATPQPLQ